LENSIILNTYSEDKLDNLTVLFIVGKGRSGTTLLQLLLDAHPNMIIPIESRFFINLYSKYKNKKKWSASTIASFLSDLFTDNKIQLWKLNRNQLKRTLLAHAHLLNFNRAVKLVYLSYPSPFEKKQLLLVGDKNPVNTLFLNSIHQVFPKAKYVHMLRNCGDNVLSHRRVFKQQNVVLIAQKWVLYNRIISAFKAKRPEQVYTLRYEDLVMTPEVELKKLMHFLAIPYSPEVLNFHEKVAEHQSLASSVVKKYHPHIFQPVTTNQVGLWRHEMNEKELEQLDYIAGEMGEKYHYERHVDNSFTTVSTLRWKKFKAIVELFFWTKTNQFFYLMPFPMRHYAHHLVKLMFRGHTKEIDTAIASSKEKG
jgi:hypothetical protein